MREALHDASTRKGTSRRSTSPQGKSRARLSSWARCSARKAPMRAMTRLAPRISRLARHTSRPVALQGDAAGGALGLESLGARLGAQRAFEARNGHEEDLEVAVCRHRACISGRRARVEVIFVGPSSMPSWQRATPAPAWSLLRCGSGRPGSDNAVVDGLRSRRVCLAERRIAGNPAIVEPIQRSGQSAPPARTRRGQRKCHHGTVSFRR